MRDILAGGILTKTGSAAVIAPSGAAAPRSRGLLRRGPVRRRRPVPPASLQPGQLVYPRLQSGYPSLLLH